jgi:hypothetical protein
VARHLVDTIAALRAEGVPRGFLRDPDDAGPKIDAVLDRLCAARLLTPDGDRVTMDPAVALAVRLRAEDAESLRELLLETGDLLYAHAHSVRLRANQIYFGHSNPSDAAAIIAKQMDTFCARVLGAAHPILLRNRRA